VVKVISHEAASPLRMNRSNVISRKRFRFNGANVKRFACHTWVAAGLKLDTEAVSLGCSVNITLCSIERKVHCFKSLISRKCKCASNLLHLYGQELSVGILCECKCSAVVAHITITVVFYGTDAPSKVMGRSRPLLMVPWSHKSPHLKRYTDRLSNFSTALGCHQHCRKKDT